MLQMCLSQAAIVAAPHPIRLHPLGQRAMAAVWHRTATCVGRLSPAMPTGRGGTGGQDGVASLELDAAAPAHLCTRYGALPLVSAGGAADHRGHHAGG